MSRVLVVLSCVCLSSCQRAVPFVVKEPPGFVEVESSSPQIRNGYQNVKGVIAAGDLVGVHTLVVPAGAKITRHADEHVSVLGRRGMMFAGIPETIVDAAAQVESIGLVWRKENGELSIGKTGVVEHFEFDIFFDVVEVRCPSSLAVREEKVDARDDDGRDWNAMVVKPDLDAGVAQGIP